MKKNGISSNIIYALRNIWKWDKAYYLYFISSIPFAIILPLAGIYFQKLIIDLVQNSESVSYIICVIGLYFILLFFVDLITRFCSSRLGMRKYNFSTLYQMEISEKFMRTDYSNTDNPNINILYSHAMNDACSGQCAPEFILESLLSFLISILGIFTYGTIITMISPVILILLMLSAAATYLVSRWIKNYSEKNKDKWTVIDRKIDYLSKFSSSFEYAKDIRVYGMINWLNGLLVGFQKDRFVWTKKVSFRSLCGSFIGAALILLQDGVAYAILIIMLKRNEINVGDFVFYFGVITGFSAWLNGIVADVSDIIGKSIKINYYRDYFNISENYNHNQGCAVPANTNEAVDIEFCNVCYRYPCTDKYVVKNINLKINKGERLAVVGQNGAGKTTLIKLLCGFYFPTEGTVKVNGVPVSEYNIEDYYTLFSAVFQDVYLLPVTIAEFVSSSDDFIDYEKVNRVIEKAGLDKKVRLLSDGINTRLMKGVFDNSIELSGGEKQKLMLARALYKDAPIIILDEPTAALDPIAENNLYLEYSGLTEHKTSIYISHRLASTRFCDRIIFVDNGEIVEIGTHDELMQLNGKYAYMYNLQSQYYKEDSENA